MNGHVDQIVGRYTSASNATLLGRAGGDLVVYKPIAGNRPLWDFDVGTLAYREVLTHRAAELMGLDGLVPETVMGDGPFGPGAVQRHVPDHPAFDPIPLVQRADPSLWPIAVLDLVANNADRKIGHILADPDTGSLRAIDHGLTFHPDPKLRTVLWGFAGEALPSAMLEALERIDGRLEMFSAQVGAHLGDDAAGALEQRVAGLLSDPVHPGPPDDRPAVPWPPF